MLLIRSVQVCSPPHCSNKWGTGDSERDTQDLKSQSKCLGQKPQLFAGSRETHDGLCPHTKKWGYNKADLGRVEGPLVPAPTEGGRGQSYALLHAVVGSVSDLGDEGQCTCGKKQRALDLLVRAGLAATCSPPAPEFPLQGRPSG